MHIEQWWTRLTPDTRAWLVANNGDSIPAGLAREIAAAGGPELDGIGSDPAGTLPDHVSDWIEAKANDEE
ncbi:MAG: hypothetical protein ABWZ77_04905 [Naasia sp.]